MKKAILVKSAMTLAIAASMSAPAYAAEVSGRFRVALIESGDEWSERDYGGRFRFSGEEDVGNGNTVFGKYEFATDASEGELRTGKRTRLGYVGIKGGFGSLSLGTRWSPYYNVVTSPVDWTKAFGGTWGPGAGYKGGFRQDNGVFYSHGGFQAMAQLRESSTDEDGVVSDDDDVDAWELGYTHSLGGFSGGIAYRDAGDNELLGLSLAGTMGPVRVALSLHDEDGSTGLLGQIRGNVGSGVVSLSFGQEDNDSGVEPSMIGLEYDQAMSKNTSWFVGYESTDLDDGSDDVERFGGGLHYNFN